MSPVRSVDSVGLLRRDILKGLSAMQYQGAAGGGGTVESGWSLEGGTERLLGSGELLVPSNLLVDSSAPRLVMFVIYVTRYHRVHSNLRPAG